jgi:glycosyltransferase involved in cell wall biosynthesis
LDLDVVYAFHNTNAAAVLQSWPDARRILAINLIGFGIDPSRGGASDTFPLQQRIFDRPSWDLHVTATRFEYDQYRRVYEYLGIDERKLMHLPHCVDEEVFTPGDRDPNGRANRSIQTILYPVNVYPRKNIELALEVLAIVSSKIDCRLIVTGSVWDRPYRDRLLALAKRLGVGDRVSFLGGVPFEELVRLYQNSDVTVYTSHQETFGHGIAESLACGTPVVGPDWIIPCREILLQASGGTAAQKEPASFAATLLAAMSNQPDKISIAEDARRRFGNRSIAAAFLARCREIRDAKEATAKRVRSIDWKGMYEDAGDLL